MNTEVINLMRAAWAVAQTEPTVVVMLLAAIGGMASAVAYLHKTLMDQMREVQDALSDCQRDREALWMVLAQQQGTDVSELKKQFQLGAN